MNLPQCEWSSTEAASSQRFPAYERGDDTSIIVVVKSRVTLQRLHASGTRGRDRQSGVIWLYP